LAQSLAEQYFHVAGEEKVIAGAYISPAGEYFYIAGENFRRADD
jgi:hypothetical protein